MNLIVAVDMNWGIGYDNDLLIYIPNDLKNFKKLTTDNIVVYGSKTLKSFKNGNPLPNRTNVMITRQKDINIENVIVKNSIEEVLQYAKEQEELGRQVFIIGGEQIYNQLYEYCEYAYITKIFDEFLANKHFPNIDKKGWTIVETIANEVYTGQKNDQNIEYAILKYKNNNPKAY